MTDISPELREFAETPNRWLLPAPRIDVRDTGRYVLVHGVTWASVVRVTCEPEEVADVLDDVRAQAGESVHMTWWLGPSVRPPDVFARLLALGLREADPSRLDALIAVDPPEAGPADVDVTRVATIDDYATAIAIRNDAFETPPERRAVEEANRDANWERDQANCVLFLAHVDGRPAATAMTILGERGSFLVGGATAPWARGRGAYRALVRARWDHAVARGAPALVVHANPATSGPILRRLGFRFVCELRRLEDPGPQREDG